MRAIRTDKSSASGFTLIEVLVALAIAALGLGFLMAATGAGLQNAAVADQFIQATSRAQTRLAQIGVTMLLKQGDFKGDDGGGFGWSLHIGPPASHVLPGDKGGALALYPVTATISWRSGLSQRSVSFYSERTGPP